MSAHPEAQVSLPTLRKSSILPVQYAALATALAVFGLTTIWPTMLSFWLLWTGDALKSIGMVVPLVSLILVLRVWRKLGWHAEGTWWGLALLLFAMAVAQVQQRAVLIMVVSPQWSTALPPPSLVLLAYGSGVVLLLGGTRLYRAALFPILLLWFANPIPHVFSLLVDLPLQSVSASIARRFAMSLGYPLTPDHLRLMFTPEFGMFIAPGCNGIRGAVTMGFIALIAGYIYRFRWYINALVVMAAILLGYLFNLVRLCLLVLYYAVALHFTSLQDKAENADYLIGAALFLIATLLLLEAVRRLGGDDRQTEVKVIPPNGIAVQGSVAGRRYAQLAAMGAMVLFGCAGLAQARVATRSTRAIAAAAGSRFPEHLGNYVLERSWSETMLGGEVIYVWGEYKPLGGGTPIAIGLAPALGWHDPLICHATRGEHPLWQGQLTVATADSAPVSFSSAFYNDGVTQYLEASTQCAGASCGEFATQRTHFGFIFSRPEPGTFLSQTPQRSIPILIRAEMVDMTIPADAARTELTSDLRTFLAPVSMNDLTQSGDR